MLEKHKNAFGEILEEVTADSGYCSEKNLLYLKDHTISSYINLQDQEKRKTRAYTEDIGKYYNMKTQIFEDVLYYVCHDGRELHHIRTEKKEQSGYTQTFEVYGCADCSGCGYKAKCLYKYNAEKDAEKNKVMKINEQWEVLKEESHANIQSEKGILNRQIRSIQTEGHFGDIKENDVFRRFKYRPAVKVYKEFMLYAIGRNINKYHAVDPDHRHLLLQAGLDVVVVARRDVHPALLRADAPGALGEVGGVGLVGAHLLGGDDQVEVQRDVSAGLAEQLVIDVRDQQIRSIQTEGHFGDIKENDGFRRFNYRTAEKVYKEFMLYAIGRNINKYHRFLHDEIKKFEGKAEEKTA